MIVTKNPKIAERDRMELPRVCVLALSSKADSDSNRQDDSGIVYFMWRKAVKQTNKRQSGNIVCSNSCQRTNQCLKREVDELVWDVGVGRMCV